MAGMVDISAHTQAHIQTTKAKNDLIGDSHSKQLLLIEKFIFQHSANVIKSTTYWTNCPSSIKKKMMFFSLVTFLKNSCLLNFASCVTSFSSFGSRTRRAALIGFHTTFISSCIWGATPFALVCKVLSFRTYHRFSQFLIFHNGIATLPKNSTLWSLSSSNTVTSRTDDMSFTLL